MIMLLFFTLLVFISNTFCHETSIDLLDYVIDAESVVNCDKYCSGIFVPYLATSNYKCNATKLLDDFKTVQTPKVSDFCFTFFENVQITTLLGEHRMQVGYTHFYMNLFIQKIKINNQIFFYIELPLLCM